MECATELKSTLLSSFFHALSLDTHYGHIGFAIGHGHNGHMAIFGCYGTYGHGRWQHQYGHYGYPVKEHGKTNSSVLVSAQYHNPFKSYGHLNFDTSGLDCDLHSKNDML